MMAMFSHDGLKDSLTQLAAPPRFYDELHRELSRCARSGESFVVVKFELQATSQYEEKVLDFAEVLSEASRVEDLCARLGEYEFAILLRGSQSVAVSFIDRVIQRWKQESIYVKFWSSMVESQAGESPLELLNRLDGNPLKEAAISF
ncbi:MAG: diguanylate cyclase [Actinomycetes bacterium]